MKTKRRPLDGPKVDLFCVSGLFKAEIVGLFFSKNIHSKGNLKVLWARTQQQTVIFYRKNFCALIYNLIQNNFFFAWLFLKKEDFMPKRMTF